jgi:C4-dicarboxylate-specific signal transduction histidine kinase
MQPFLASSRDKPALYDPARLRIRIILGAILVLSIINAAYIYDTIELVSEHTRRVEAANFVLNVQSIQRHLEERIAQVPTTSLQMGSINSIAVRVAFLKLSDKRLTFGLFRPTVLRLAMADGLSDLSHNISDTEQRKIAGFLDSIQANGRAKDFYLSPLPQTDSTHHIVDIDLVDYLVVASPLVESAGMLFVVQKLSEHEIATAQALKQSLIFAGAVFWLGIWFAIILSTLMGRQLKASDQAVTAAYSQIIQASKLATLGQMATSIAHELNQPLNVIRMAAGNSRRKISNGTVDPEYLNAKLERIEEQTARAAAIIDHMRMFGREANEELEPINPRAMVTNALDLMGEQLRLAGIEIVTELAQDCPSVIGHTIQMEQVVLNLLSNAKDAMAESEGEKKITLRVFEDDKGVHITAEDAGGGIPEDVLPRIFEPFYTTKEMGKGTGLGLSVSYGIINDMNGTIIAENVNDGARFTITLPSVS